MSIAVSTPTSSIQVETSETITSMFTQTKYTTQTDGLSTSSTPDIPVSSSTGICKNNIIVQRILYICIQCQHLSSTLVGPTESQLSAPTRVSGTAVGGAIAALLILAVFAAAGITILIVVLVRRRNVHKSNTCTYSLNAPYDLDDKQSDHPPVLELQSAEQMELQQNTCYAPTGSYMYKQGAPPDPVLLDQPADPVQLQQNMCYAATSAGSYKQQGDQETDIE